MLYLAFLAVLVSFLMKDVFSFFSLANAFGIILLMFFGLSAFFLAKYKIPEIQKRNSEAKTEKEARIAGTKERNKFRNLVNNNMANDENE
ncbi:hypothetical protein [Pseudomonas juntendi]|uniref:hypothetical protein n=1 Tax=Pseudomonas juntendi TaxID=2666183 RepID=UPI00244AC412|nr:hypothetical protein [Pseudomonas juntendi]MDG9889245.1 hypothetical protein [Pseudomonas juntendi]